MDIAIVLFRCLIFYLIIGFFYRIMGKREIGELSVMDFIVSLFVAELAAISVENFDDSIWFSLGPITLLVVTEIIIAKLSLKFEKFRNIVEGEVSVIINRGKVNFQEMLKQRYNLDDLLSQLRGQGIKSIEEVDYAILETSGKLSVFKKNSDASSVYPLPVIIDGEVQEDVLIQIKKDIKWLEEMIKKEGYVLEDIFYGFYRKNNLYLIRNENIK